MDLVESRTCLNSKVENDLDRVVVSVEPYENSDIYWTELIGWSASLPNDFLHLRSFDLLINIRAGTGRKIVNRSVPARSFTGQLKSYD